MAPESNHFDALNLFGAIAGSMKWPLRGVELVPRASAEIRLREVRWAAAISPAPRQYVAQPLAPSGSSPQWRAMFDALHN